VGVSFWDSVNPDFGKSIRYPFRYSNLVAVEDIPSAAGGFELYPNPARDRLTLRYDHAAGRALHYEVYSMLGEKVLEGAPRESVSGSWTEHVHTHGLQPGSYVMTVVDGRHILAREHFTVVR